MIRAAYLLLAASAGLAAWFGYLAWQAKVQAFVPINGQVKDFGTLRQGETVEVVFRLRNGFPQALTIEGVKKSCDCVDVRGAPKSVAPGEEFRLTAKWRIGGARGSVENELWVVYERVDSERGAVRLVTKAEVVPDIATDRSEVAFRRDEAGAVVVALEPGAEKAFELKRAYAEHRAFTVTADPSARRVRVGFDPKHWSKGDESVEHRLSIVTSGKHEPVISLPIQVRP
ncbi:MAG: DUF1573 domain-containing protein [Gemmataceae bacterium]|nr:DUF1573 domain-containing protein [Gemmataceae bacterium]